MAVNPRKNGSDQLQGPYSQAGGIVAVAMGALAAGLAIVMLSRWGAHLTGGNWALAVPFLFVAGAVLAALGALLLTGQTWAQPALLSVLGIYLIALVTSFAGTLVGAGPRPLWDYAAMVALLALVAAAMGVLWNASAPDSRLRFGSNVIVATALALAVLLVFNVIAQGSGNYWRTDLQLLGQYGLSERSKKVLKGVREPVRITVLYSTSEANQASAERGSRAWELLSEIHDLNPRIEVARVLGEGDRAAVIARVAQQARDRAPAHAKLLKDFLAEAPKMLDALREQQTQWRRLAGGSYLDLWGAAAQVGDLVKDLLQEQEELTFRLPKDLAGMPDYAKLAEDVKAVSTRWKNSFSTVEQSLKRLAKIPAAVAANQQAATAKLEEVSAALKEAQKALEGASASGPAASKPSDPSAILQQYIAAIEKAAEKATDASKALDEVAGIDNAGVVRGSSAWLLPGDERPVVVGGMVMMARPNVTREFLNLAEGLTRQKAAIEGILQRETKESQAKAVEALRAALGDVLDEVGQLTLTARKAVARLATVDDATAALFKQVSEGKYLQNLQAPLAKLAEEADRLPALPPSTLAEDLSQENVVLVETADKTEAVPFDQVWPLVARPRGPGMMETLEQRVFAGDSAIASKVLALTQRPCGTVILAYMEVSPQMAQMGGGDMSMTPRMLEELQARLRQANFRVKTWDLSTHEEPVDVTDPNDPPMPKVLLVLPPPAVPPMMMRPDDPTSFGPRQIERVRRLLDSNEAAGAIFLAQFQFPMGPYGPPPDYGWNQYLQSDWGVQAKTNYLVIPAEPDKATGTRLRLAAPRLGYLPLSAFSDHPIGKPLQGQRVFWQYPCPVEPTKQRPRGVTVRSLLTVPAYWNTTWATSDIERVQHQIDEAGSYISPDYEHGDIQVPFDLAVVSARQPEPNQGAAPSRVVVLGLGASMVDSYVSQRIVTLKEENVIAAEEPPRANLDVIVNSAYWLCGRQDFIAAGPVQVQPIGTIRQTTYRVLWTLCVIALPAAVLAAGGLVLLLRRR